MVSQCKKLVWQSIGQPFSYSMLDQKKQKERQWSSELQVLMRKDENKVFKAVPIVKLDGKLSPAKCLPAYSLQGLRLMDKPPNSGYLFRLLRTCRLSNGSLSRHPVYYMVHPLEFRFYCFMVRSLMSSYKLHASSMFQANPFLLVYKNFHGTEPENQEHGFRNFVTTRPLECHACN